MRLAPLLALLALAPALHAQGTPDPTPPEAYYPLHVGDQWEYRDYDPQPNPERYPYERRTVTKDTVVSGRLYFVVRTQRFRVGSEPVAESRRIVRFDTTAANVRIAYSGGGSEENLFPCRLDLPVPDGGGAAFCNGDQYVSYRVHLEATIAVGGSIITTPVRTITSTALAYWVRQVAAGVGLISDYGCEGSCTDLRLEYARVDGVESGQKIPGLGNEPDPTPPADYYPLEVGNDWIYYESVPFFNSEVYRRRRIVREDVVAGQRYAVEQFCSYDLRATAPAWACGDERLVRFDPATTGIVTRNVNGEQVVICNLGADFESAGPCRYMDFGTGPVVIGGTAYPVARVKAPVTLADPSPPPFAAGIGPLEQTLTGPLSASRFEYARVRGVEYGVRPVAGEVGAVPSGSLALSASPNPTDGPLALALTLPEAGAVTVEAFDALGRRVWQTTAALSAGAQTLAVDASAWAPGVYVVRATAAGGGGAGRASATARVVRR